MIVELGDRSVHLGNGAIILCNFDINSLAWMRLALLIFVMSGDSIFARSKVVLSVEWQVGRTFGRTFACSNVTHANCHFIQVREGDSSFPTRVVQRVDSRRYDYCTLNTTLKSNKITENKSVCFMSTYLSHN